MHRQCNIFHQVQLHVLFCAGICTASQWEVRSINASVSCYFGYLALSRDFGFKDASDS